EVDESDLPRCVRRTAAGERGAGAEETGQVLEPRSSRRGAAVDAEQLAHPVLQRDWALTEVCEREGWNAVTVGQAEQCEEMIGQHRDGWVGTGLPQHDLHQRGQQVRRLAT